MDELEEVDRRRVVHDDLARRAPISGASRSPDAAGMSSHVAQEPIRPVPHSPVTSSASALERVRRGGIPSELPSR